MTRKIEFAVLVVYTWMNLFFLWPALVGENADTFRIALLVGQGMGGTRLLAVLLALFLNAALIIYVLRLGQSTK